MKNMTTESSHLKILNSGQIIS
jgi:folate-binding Fe-S cluster repair protein YgfZ